MAADDDQQLTDFQKQKALLDAQKGVADAQKALADSQKGLLDSQKALLDSQKAAATLAADGQKLADLQSKKAVLDAQKALADSQKAAEQASSGAAQQLADLQNQKALLDAQKALADSKKAVEQAGSGSTQQLGELQNQKAMLDAQKALSDAQAQATLARYIGDVKAGPYSGSVDVKAKGGTQEAALLAARAVNEAAAKVVTAVQAKGGSNFYVFAAKDFPNFQRLLTFRFRKALIKQAFAAAGVQPASPIPDRGEDHSKASAEGGLTAGLVSSGLDAFSKLLGFFKTDYTVDGIDVKLDESLLLFSVAGRLATAEKTARLPMIYQPDAQSLSVQALAAELSELAALRAQAASTVKRGEDFIARTEKKVAAEGAKPAEKDAAAQDIAASKAEVDPIKGAISLYDGFASALTTPDAGGAVPLTFVAEELAIESALKVAGAQVLLLRLESTGGGYLIKKNLFTGLGCVPLFHMGGATVTYLLLSGPDGTVLAGDTVPIHGGFVRSDKLQAHLDTPIG